MYASCAAMRHPVELECHVISSAGCAADRLLHTAVHRHNTLPTSCCRRPFHSKRSRRWTPCDAPSRRSRAPRSRRRPSFRHSTPSSLSLAPAALRRSTGVSTGRTSSPCRSPPPRSSRDRPVPRRRRSSRSRSRISVDVERLRRSRPRRPSYRPSSRSRPSARRAFCLGSTFRRSTPALHADQNIYSCYYIRWKVFACESFVWISWTVVELFSFLRNIWIYEYRLHYGRHRSTCWAPVLSSFEWQFKLYFRPNFAHKTFNSFHVQWSYVIANKTFR